MEVAALAGLLAMGYALTRGGRSTDVEASEGFAAQEPLYTVDGQAVFPNGGMPPPLYDQDKTAPGAATVPGKPRQPRPTADGDLDLYYNLPSGGSLPSTPATQPDLYPRNLLFSSPSTPQAPLTSVTAQVRMNADGAETPAVYNSGRTVVSALTGLPMNADEFTHNNMVPFFRGAPKQNMTDNGSRSMLDNMVGAGYDQIGKREQAPLFDPHREPVGNVNGLESTTDFMQDRMVVSMSRANEKPVEPVQVGPGLNQGYTSFPTGGFQQLDINDIMRQYKSVDETRVESDPKLTYEGMMIPGKSLALQRGDLGEVRKYRPDTFFLNESGERNFVTAGENTKPTERGAQVLKFQAREETENNEYMGPAASADFEATYTVPSFRAPHARQQDGYGYRNADGSTYGTRNTDAENNDFGRAGYDLPVNQRNVTGERGQTMNLTAAGAPKAMTVYDPNDVARTTVRESTGANDWIGVAGAVSAKKLTVYDPTDITRVTTRNLNAEPDRAMNVTRAGMPGQGTLSFPDGMRATTKSQVSAASNYGGAAGPAVSKAEQVYDYAYAMRQNPTKELVAAGRKPIAGAGTLSLFSGEDFTNMTSRKLDTDILNDRAMTSDRVVGPPPGQEVIGLQRPKDRLQIDVSVDRNIQAVLDTLNDNPYAMPIYKIAQQGRSPAELAALSLSGSQNSW
jgi:hypothetical protein